MYIISIESFYKHKKDVFDGYVFWKQVDDRIYIKLALPQPGLIQLLNILSK